MQFRIEYVSTLRGTGYVLARQLDPGDFTLPERPTLGGIAIARHLSQPRSLLADGTPDLTVFAFHLASPSDTDKLSVGQLVELSGERA
jgi:hypothetical protein